MKRTLQEINAAIKSGDAMILTAKEIEQMLDDGRDKEVREVDVVTTGTMGIMSGTFASLSFQIAPAGKYRRFVSARMNGVPAVVGPCPNESLGVIDVMVLGTVESEKDHRYGGSHLFRDLVEGKDVLVEATSSDGSRIEVDVDIAQIPTAKLMSSRNCFRNYRAFTNPGDEGFASIFHCRPFPPHYRGITFSGCGHLNPAQNDPKLGIIGVGTKVLFNGSEGFIFSSGTRSSEKYPNFMTIADMKSMDPMLMGGYNTAVGVECLSSYAVPIPILSTGMLKYVLTQDRDIPLSIGDIRDRHKIGQSDYGQAWTGRDEVIELDVSKCIQCEECSACRACPTDAIGRSNANVSLNKARCINCGACVHACPGGCFLGDLGTITAEVNGEKREMPILCRNSNRAGAVRTMAELKRKIGEGTFVMTEKVADLKP